MTLNLDKMYDFVDERPIEWGEGVRIWIAPLSTTAYQDHMTKFNRAEAAKQAGRRRISAGAEMTPEREAAMKKGLAKYIMRRWEGVTDLDTGETVEYTPELGLELLESVVFFGDILTAAADAEAFRRERLEEAAKNSETLSDTGDDSESTTPQPAVSFSMS